MSTTPNNDAPASEALAAKSQQSGISGRMLAIFYLIAIVLGIVNGIWGSSATQSFADFIATMFIRLFKFVAIPIIAVSIISTLSSISKSRSSGRIFRHTIFYTLFTTIWRQRSPLCSTKSFHRKTSPHRFPVLPQHRFRALLMQAARVI